MDSSGQTYIDFFELAPDEDKNRYRQALEELKEEKDAVVKELLGEADERREAQETTQQGQAPVQTQD